MKNLNYIMRIVCEMRTVFKNGYKAGIFVFAFISGIPSHAQENIGEGRMQISLSGHQNVELAQAKDDPKSFYYLPSRVRLVLDRGKFRVVGDYYKYYTDTRLKHLSGAYLHCMLSWGLSKEEERALSDSLESRGLRLRGPVIYKSAEGATFVIRALLDSESIFPIYSIITKGSGLLLPDQRIALIAQFDERESRLLDKAEHLRDLISSDIYNLIIDFSFGRSNSPNLIIQPENKRKETGGWDVLITCKENTISCDLEHIFKEIASENYNNYNHIVDYRDHFRKWRYYFVLDGTCFDIPNDEIKEAIINIYKISKNGTHQDTVLMDTIRLTPIEPSFKVDIPMTRDDSSRVGYTTLWKMKDGEILGPFNIVEHWAGVALLCPIVERDLYITLSEEVYFEMKKSNIDSVAIQFRYTKYGQEYETYGAFALSDTGFYSYLTFSLDPLPIIHDRDQNDLYCRTVIHSQVRGWVSRKNVSVEFEKSYRNGWTHQKMNEGFYDFFIVDEEFINLIIKDPYPIPFVSKKPENIPYPIVDDADKIIPLTQK